MYAWLIRGSRYRPFSLLAPGVVAALLVSGCMGEADTESAESASPRAVTVTHVAVSHHALEESEQAIATISATRSPQVGAEVDGIVQRLTVDEGTMVRENDLLAIIEDTEHQLNYRSAQADMRHIDVQIEQRNREVARLERLHEGGSASQLTLEEAQSDVTKLELERVIAQAEFERAERRLAKTRVLAPYGGVISARYTSEGDHVSEGTTLFELIDYSRLRIRIVLPESYLNRLAEGLEVRLWREGEEQTPTSAVIDRLTPSIDGSNRAVTALSYVENAPQTWRSGGSLRAEVVLESREALLVPPEAIVRRPAGLVVYLLDDANVRERAVETGMRTRDWVEIRSGLAAGDLVVADGAGFLTDGASVQSELRAWQPQDGRS